MYVVIYTDGSSKPNPGRTGWGAHGYLYAEPSKQSRKAGDCVITTHGYLTREEIEKHELPVAPVNPLEYYDFCSFETHHGGNNIGELSAVIKTLAFFQDRDVKSIAIKTDSEYVIKGANEHLPNWKARDWKMLNGGPTQMADLWQEFDRISMLLQSRDIDITLSWVKGHQNYGNIIADQLAKVSVQFGSIQNTYEDYTVTPAKDYGKSTPLKHPLLCFRRLFFSTQTQLDGGRYLVAEPAGDVDKFGKRDSEAAYAVVHLREPDAIIEHVKNAHRTCTATQACTVVGHLDRIHHKAVSPFIYKYGRGCLIPSVSKQRFGSTSLDFINGKNLTTELVPTGLSFLGMETLEHLNTILSLYKENTLGLSEVPHHVLGEDYFVTDITDHLYDKDDGVSFKSIYGPGSKSLELTTTVSLHNKSHDLDISLHFGKDLPHRNALKNLETESPVVQLVVWAESLHLFRYVCIVQVTDGIGIWSSCHSNIVFSSP